MGKLFGVIGTSTPRALYADLIDMAVRAVAMEPATSGALTRGTVIYKKETGLWAAASSENAVATKELAVLNEDVDLAEDPAGNIAPNAAAIVSGHLLRDKVTLSEGAAVTTSAELALRNQGIYLLAGINSTGYANVVYSVTYKAGTDGTGDDYVETVNDVNVTLLDLAAAAEKFTQAEHHITKFNTAANGSGTDYALGATAALDQNLTLYCIWEAD